VECIDSRNACTATHRLDTAARLRKALRQFDPDIIHTLHFSDDYLGRLAGMGLRPVVITNIRNVSGKENLFADFSTRHCPLPLTHTSSIP